MTGNPEPRQGSEPVPTSSVDIDPGTAGIATPLAVVMRPLGAAARSRMLEILPRPLRDAVSHALDQDDRPGRSFVAQVLRANVARVFGDEEEPEADMLQEVFPLQVADPVALVLNHAAPRQAAAVLRSLPLRLQGDVLHRMAALNWQVLQARMGREEATFLHQLDKMLGEAGRRASPEFAAAVLLEIGAAQQIRSLLSAMYRMDPESTASVQDLMYDFGSLSRLTDLELQAVLTGVDNWDLALALRESPDALRRRILSNVSDRRRIHLIEDEAALQYVADEAARALQLKMVNRARHLYEAGKVYTYLGSVATLGEDRKVEDQPEEVVRGVRPGSPGPVRTRDHRGLVAVMAGSMLALLLVWLLGVRFAGGGSGSGRHVSPLGGGGSVQGMDRSEGPGGNRGGPSKASHFAHSEGDVVVVRADGEEEPPDLSALKPGDVIASGDSGRAVVRLWADGGAAQLESSSEVQMGEAGDPTGEPPRLKIRLGNVWIYSNHPSLEVEVPLARLSAAQGSLYRLRIVLDATTDVSVHQGTVWVTPLIDGAPHPVVIGSGSRVHLEPSGRIEVGTVQKETGWLGIL